MNRITIIGNLCSDPTTRTTQSGLTVCGFTVAVNRRRSSNTAAEGQPEADFFRVSAWRQLGENCAKYLSKGKKVCVIGPVSLRTFTGQDGQTHASLEVTADDVEFLSSRSDAPESVPAPAPSVATAKSESAPPPSKYVEVTDEELPFE